MYSLLYVSYILIKRFKQTITIIYFVLESGSRQGSARKPFLGLSHGGDPRNTQVAESETLEGFSGITLSLSFHMVASGKLELLTSLRFPK